MSDVIPAYPLQWPIGWPRADEQANGRFSKGERKTVSYGDGSRSSYVRQREITIAEALRRVRDELRRFGIDDDDIVISSNVPLRLDGFPRSGAREPDDSGVAVYWRYSDGSGKRCMAIDRYRRVAHNLAAIAATLDAMRAIDRHGGAEILDRAFSGFMALPAPDAAPHWSAVLGCRADDDLATIKAAYRVAASAAHPDKGGSDERMAAVNAAWAAAQKERS